MAVTSLWRIKGNIGKVILYIENPDKTLTQEVIKTNNDDRLDENVLMDVMTYISRGSATKDERLIDSVNCEVETALEEMMRRAEQRGANAVVGVDIDYEVLGANNGMLMVTASGTAVIIE